MSITAATLFPFLLYFYPHFLTLAALNTIMQFSFKKEERIYKRDEIKLLFEKGNGFLVHPFKVLHLEVAAENIENSTPLKVGVSIPKRRFKKAVDRNLLKRRTKEAYRLNRNELKSTLLSENKQLLVMFIYVNATILKQADIEDKIILILKRLQGIYAKNS